MNSARIKAYLALAACALIWGASQPLVKPALSYMSASQFLFLRYAVAAPLILPFLIQGLRKHHLTTIEWVRIIIIETIGIGTLFLLYTGLHYISAIQSALIIQTRPVFITLAGIVFLHEREEGHEWIGLTLSVLGTFIILLAPYILNSSGFEKVSILGISILLLTNVIYTAGTLLTKRFYKKVPKTTISGVHMWLGMIIFALYLGIGGNLPTMSIMTQPSVIAAVLYMAIPGSIIALTLSLYGLGKIEASEAVLFNYLEPFVYIPLSMVLLNESLSPFQVVGMLCIGLGVWWAERRPTRSKKPVTQGIPLSAKIRLAELPLPSPHHR